MLNAFGRITPIGLISNDLNVGILRLQFLFEAIHPLIIASQNQVRTPGSRSCRFHSALSLADQLLLLPQPITRGKERNLLWDPFPSQN